MRQLKRVWLWIVILWLVLLAYPVEDRTTRIAEVAGGVVVWVGALALWWRIKYVRMGLALAIAILALPLSLPRRAVDREALATEYSRGLRRYAGLRYVWGGEGFLGIDCSGLVRKGLIWGQITLGLRTFNGGLMRDAVSLWWNDCPAKDLVGGHRLRTRVLFEAPSVAGADHMKLQPGDLAVTADGVHVLAYLGDRVWIEADPNAGNVIEVRLPTENPWFKVPVVFGRWECLDR